MPKLILLRHGQSQWNLENRFTGIKDVPLSTKGKEEAKQAGELMKDFPIDRVYTSVLERAIDTATIALESRGGAELPTERDAALNERDYGDLQGLNKADTAKKFGDEQVKIWRRSFDVSPPGGESLKDTADRTLPYFKDKIMADIKAGKNVLVVAHGNSLRAVVMFLEELSPEKIVELNLPTGVPMVYEMETTGKVASSRQHLSSVS